MNPITHLLIGWEVGYLGCREARDRNLVAWAGVAPDLDGFGIVVDLGNRVLGRPETFLYGAYHHALLHGLFGALLCSAVLFAAGVQRWRTAFLGFLAFHVHLLCDVVGSRGPTVDDLWPIHYLAPFSERLSNAWPHQWPVNAWPNIALTVLLLGVAFRRAIVYGLSPVSLFGVTADRAFITTVRKRWSQMQRKRA